VRRGLHAVTWDAALDDLAAKIQAIVDRYGADAIGAYYGGGSSFDAAGYRLARKFFYALGTRSAFSSATLDAPCRPYVAELITGQPFLYGRAIDYENATLTLLVGLNPLVSHGHTSGFPNPHVRMRHLMSRGEVWVVDPRRTETANVATRHLAPRPGTDHIWLAAVIRALLENDVDVAQLKKRTSGLERLVEAVAPFGLDDAASKCGVERSALEDLLTALRRHGRVAALGGTGVSMSAHANVTEWLIWALSIITDSIDTPGGTWINPGFLKSLDKKVHPVLDGSSEPGPASRPELPRRLNEYPAVAMVDEIEAGNLRGLIVVGANPVTALPQTPRLIRALKMLDVLAVADVVGTETTELASHIFAVAGMLERADLPANVEVTYPAVATQYTKAVVPLGANRWPMWRVFAELGQRLDLQLLPSGLSPSNCTDDDVLAPIAAGGRSSFDSLRAADQCVVDADAIYGWVREKVLPDGRFRVAPEPLVRQLAELPAPPRFVLVPRRQLRHVNSQMTLEGTADGRRDTPSILLHPADAEEIGVSSGMLVNVESEHGSIVGVAEVVQTIRRGSVSVPHGYGTANVNHLTTGADVDALTGMPTYSGLPISVSALAMRGIMPEAPQSFGRI
jgi:anaerobic selenocysteine-containing dehydrogenase